VDDKVAQFPGTVSHTDVQLNCIEVAEDLLAKAKSGAIISIVAICDCPGDKWEYVKSAALDNQALLGKVTMILYRVATRMFQDDGEG
jgi:hypothetical protein